MTIKENEFLEIKKSIRAMEASILQKFDVLFTSSIILNKNTMTKTKVWTDVNIYNLATLLAWDSFFDDCLLENGKINKQKAYQKLKQEIDDNNPLNEPSGIDKIRNALGKDFVFLPGVL